MSLFLRFQGWQVCTSGSRNKSHLERGRREKISPTFFRLRIYFTFSDANPTWPKKYVSTKFEKCEGFVFTALEVLAIYLFSFESEFVFIRFVKTFADPSDMHNRRIYIANFATFKIATFWSYHLHLREKSRSFSFTKLRDFLVGSAHVRSQATVHAFMHAAHAVCMRAEDIDTRFKERA